ncbi:MAG: hypothetical protein JXN61_01365 [Sedimentisphaerales bacterium]|nr:hypothetical protein [Sedimentisphaerales bacterium]
MSSVIVILVVIAAALVMASGVWVATALIRTLTRSSANPNSNPPTDTRP